MQATSRPGSDPRLRPVAVLLTCLLGLALITAARPALGHHHPAHGVAVLTTARVDGEHVTTREDQHGTVSGPPVTTVSPIGRFTTVAVGRSASGRTQHTQPVRGPPVQVAA